MTVARETGAVDTHAVVDLANGFAVVGYALFAYQQPGPINVLRPIQRVDVTTPVADLVAATVAARYDAGVYETVDVAPVVEEVPVATVGAPPPVVEETPVAPVETVAEPVAEPVAVETAETVEVMGAAVPVAEVPASASFQPEGDLGYVVQAPLIEEIEPEPAPVKQVVVDESKRISAPTLSWDPEVWKPAAEKEAALKRLGEHGEVHGAIDDPEHAAGIAYDEPVEAPTPTAPAGRSTVSMLQELSFLDD